MKKKTLDWSIPICSQIVLQIIPQIIHSSVEYYIPC